MTKVEFLTTHEISLKQNVNRHLKEIEETGCEINRIQIEHQHDGMYAVLITYER